MSTKELKKLFDQCKKKWGLEMQVLKLAEESSELTTISFHLLRDLENPDVRERFSEEIADTVLMIEEMLYYFGNAERVQQIREAKIERLKAVLSNG